jgi:Myb/SANT-like DNA-binding domain
MKDPSNTAATKEARNQAWKDIQQALQDQCLSAARNVDQLQKKWNNLKDKAKKEYSMERKSINGTFIVSFVQLHVKKFRSCSRWWARI